MELSGHQMEIVSIDGADVEPMKVKSFTFAQATRVDAIICADNDPGDYIITGTYLLGCPLVFLGKSKTCSYQAALHYMNYYGPPPMDPPAPQGPIDGTGGGSASALEQKANHKVQMLVWLTMVESKCLLLMQALGSRA